MTRELTLTEIAAHSSPNDFWLIMNGEVFEFIEWNHPGGWYRIQDYAGGPKDALDAFEGAHGSLYIQTFEANSVRNRKIGVVKGASGGSTGAT